MVVQHIDNQGSLPLFIFAPVCFSLPNFYLVWTTASAAALRSIGIAMGNAPL
jgi:hypothetical protein